MQLSLMINLFLYIRFQGNDVKVRPYIGRKAKSEDPWTLVEAVCVHS